MSIDPLRTIASAAIQSTVTALHERTADWSVAHLAATLAEELPDWAAEVGLDTSAVLGWLETLARTPPDDATYRAALLAGWARLLVLETAADLGT